MVMQALTHLRHITVGWRFYMAQFFDRQTGEVLAGPIPDKALDPAAAVLGRAASAPALRRLTREQYELVPGDQEYPWPTLGPHPGARMSRVKPRRPRPPMSLGPGSRGGLILAVQRCETMEDDASQ